jgi:hypothetical protein
MMMELIIQLRNFAHHLARPALDPPHIAQHVSMIQCTLSAAFVLFVAQQCQDVLHVMILVHVQVVKTVIILRSQIVVRGFVISLLNVYIFA